MLINGYYLGDNDINAHLLFVNILYAYPRIYNTDIPMLMLACIQIFAHAYHWQDSCMNLRIQTIHLAYCFLGAYATLEEVTCIEAHGALRNAVKSLHTSEHRAYGPFGLGCFTKSISFFFRVFFSFSFIFRFFYFGKPLKYHCILITDRVFSSKLAR